MTDRLFYDVHSYNLKLSEDGKVVTRNNTDGSGIVYLMDDLGEDEELCLRVDEVDPMHEGFRALSLKLGLTTCDPSVVANFPYHLIEPCQPSHDCEGRSMVINVHYANLIHDEIRMERKAGGVLRVFVNDVIDFSLTDPRDSLFPFSKGPAYPFLMLTGSVSQVTTIRNSGTIVIVDDDKSNEVIRNQKPQRSTDHACCVICMDKVISHMAVPCNHAAFCDVDAKEHLKSSKVCPVCRKNVTNFVRIFIP
jgi:hypothetical protein